MSTSMATTTAKTATIMAAHNEWTRRPADERFWSLLDLHAAAVRDMENSTEVTLPVQALGVAVADGKVALLADGEAAPLTNNAHRQLCGLLGMPADYVAGLPVELARDCYEHGLRVRQGTADDEEKLSFLVHNEGHLRAVTSTKYGRIWNRYVSREALLLEKDWGWKVPPARPANVEGEQTRIATAADCIEEWAGHSLAIRPGDTIAPAGIYLTRDSGFSPELFVLMVNPKAAIEGTGGRVLTPFTLLKNSEAAYGKFEVTGGLLDYVCGNHILWGASLLFEVSVRHVGDAFERAQPMLRVALDRYHSLLEDSEATFTPTIKAAREWTLPGQDAEHVVSGVVGMLRLPKKTVAAAYQRAEEIGAYGPPNTAWGMVNGLTEISQDGRMLAERHEIDLAAGKLLEIAAKRMGVEDTLRQCQSKDWGWL